MTNLKLFPATVTYMTTSMFDMLLNDLETLEGLERLETVDMA